MKCCINHKTLLFSSHSVCILLSVSCAQETTNGRVIFSDLRFLYSVSAAYVALSLCYGIYCMLLQMQLLCRFYSVKTVLPLSVTHSRQPLQAGKVNTLCGNRGTMKQTPAGCKTILAQEDTVDTIRGN